MTATQFLIVLSAGLGAGSLVTFAVIGWRGEVADYKLRAAQAVREQADMFLALAEAAQVRADALTIPTAWYETVKPNPRKRFTDSLAALGARFRPAPNGPDWAPGDLLNLPPSRLSAFPTPADLAARLAALRDPSRAFRVTRSF